MRSRDGRMYANLTSKVIFDRLSVQGKTIPKKLTVIHETTDNNKTPNSNGTKTITKLYDSQGTINNK